VNTYTLTQAQYDELHETFANRDILRILKSLQPNPAPMSKEDMVKVLEALKETNKEWKSFADSGDAGFWSAEEQPYYQATEKAITIMQSAIEGMK
jgi:hypothetical protein